MSAVRASPEVRQFSLIFETVNTKARFDKTPWFTAIFIEPESNLSAHSYQHTSRFSNSSEAFCYLISYNERNSV